MASTTFSLNPCAPLFVPGAHLHPLSLAYLSADTSPTLGANASAFVPDGLQREFYPPAHGGGYGALPQSGYGMGGHLGVGMGMEGRLGKVLDNRTVEHSPYAAQIQQIENSRKMQPRLHRLSQNTTYADYLSAQKQAPFSYNPSGNQHHHRTFSDALKHAANAAYDYDVGLFNAPAVPPVYATTPQHAYGWSVSAPEEDQRGRTWYRDGGGKKRRKGKKGRMKAYGSIGTDSRPAW